MKAMKIIFDCDWTSGEIHFVLESFNFEYGYTI